MKYPRMGEKLAEIHRLLIEAYDHYFAHGDGHCKSGEGIVTFSFPTYWDVKDGKTEPSVEVYSYVLGPHRSHYFENIDEALTEVRKWHEAEMTRDYSEDAW